VANILDLDNGNALKELAIESKAENAIMHSLTEKATRDAAAVKVLTIVTLVYLPTTAVLVSSSQTHEVIPARNREEFLTLVVNF